MLKRILSTAVLAFALLFAQQGAAWHALSHVGGTPAHSQSDPKLPQGEQCIQCAAFSQLGAACVSAAPSIDLSASHVAPPRLAAAPVYRLKLSAYQSRAPPSRV